MYRKAPEVAIKTYRAPEDISPTMRPIISPRYAMQAEAKLTQIADLTEKPEIMRTAKSPTRQSVNSASNYTVTGALDEVSSNYQVREEALRKGCTSKLQYQRRGFQ